MNGNCLYFMSCRKLAGEPNRRLSWKKKLFLFCAVYLLFRKIRCVIFPWDWVRKKRHVQILGSRSEQLTKLGHSLFSRCSTQARGLLLRLSGGRREGEPYRAEGALAEGSWASAHGLERIPHGNFLDDRKEQLSLKMETFPQGNILACIFLEVSTVILMRI